MSLPTWAEAWLIARRSDDPALMLVTIMHEQLETFRLVKDTQELVSRGQTFKASWFEVEWVNDDGTLPRCSLSVPNVSPEMGRMFLGLSTPPQVTLEVIALSQPDEPIARVPRLDLRRMRVDPLFITGDLVGKDHSAEPLGSIQVLPGNFPALYRRQRKA
jgi:hypothetical protein